MGSDDIRQHKAYDQREQPTNGSAGAFIVIEGSDGSGKGTQFRLLADQLRAEGFDVATFDFPQYEQPSSYFVRQYLNGHYGTADQIGPYTGSLFYALDRFDCAERIHEAIEAGKIVLANRFTASNMAHQGTKFRDDNERRGYFVWLDNLEYGILRIPRPDLNIVLRVPADTAQQLLDDKHHKLKHGQTGLPGRDLHESDISHLRKAVEVYDDLCQLFPKDFTRIDCTRDDALLPIGEINGLIRDTIRPFMAGVRRGQPPDTTQPASKASAADAPTPQDGSAAQPAHMRTAARDGYDVRQTANDDVRIAILRAMADARHKDDGGDGGDVPAPVAVHLVLDDISWLLADSLQRSLPATAMVRWSDPSGYTRKDDQGRYPYYLPPSFDPATAKAYGQLMHDIYDKHGNIVTKLADHMMERSDTPPAKRTDAWRAKCLRRANRAAGALLPVGSTVSVGISATTRTLRKLVEQLQEDALPEARLAAERITATVRELYPDFGDASPAKETATPASRVRGLSDTYLQANHMPAQGKAVDLLESWPRNELDLVSDILYGQGNLSLRELRSQVAGWPYERKLEVFNAVTGMQPGGEPGQSLERVHYSWDVLSDYRTFQLLLQRIAAEDLARQDLTPRYGYEMSAAVDAIGLGDMFEDCFDTSLRLHSLLQQNGYTAESQYAVLAGHRMRWKLTFNGREAFSLYARDTDDALHPDCRAVIAEMHQRLHETHPLLAEAMQAVRSAP